MTAETKSINQLMEAALAEGDRARLIESRALRPSLLDETHQHLVLVQAALKRLNEGNYGLCSVCGQWKL